MGSKKWEYLVIGAELSSNVNLGALRLGELLNAYGENGWELVQIMEYAHGIDAIFKREKEQ